MNQVIFLFLFAFLSLPLAASGSYSSLYVYPLFAKASLYTGAALSITSLLHEMDYNLLLIAAGRFRVIVGGWLLWLLMYKGVVFGLM